MKALLCFGFQRWKKCQVFLLNMWTPFGVLIGVKFSNCVLEREFWLWRFWGPQDFETLRAGVIDCLCLVDWLVGNVGLTIPKQMCNSYSLMVNNFLKQVSRVVLSHFHEPIPASWSLDVTGITLAPLGCVPKKTGWSRLGGYHFGWISSRCHMPVGS